MSKFLTLIENYDPNNDAFFTHVHDLKTLLKSHGVKFGVTGDGVFYIDDAANDKTFVVEIKSVDTGKKTEEDGESYDIVDAMSGIDPKAAAAKQKYVNTAKVKLPKAMKDLDIKIRGMSSY